jgi:hypothetical protein
MSARLKSDLFASAYLRRCAGMNITAMLRRRGAADAGAIFIKIDHLDGKASLLAPAPAGQDLSEGVDRVFTRILKSVDAADVEARMMREIKFDSDLWFLEIEDREGRSFLDEVAA